MIDPRNIIDYNRNLHDLQEHFLFCLVVAGKTAATQAKLLEKFLTSLPRPGFSPFGRIAIAISEGTLETKLMESHLGQYNRLSKAFRAGLKLNLATCTVEDLEAIHGIGPKTARMFVMQNRKDQRVAALDTHVLKYLASQGHKVPKSTPPAGATYNRLEQAFLELADKSGMSPSEFDLEIWRHYSK